MDTIKEKDSIFDSAEYKRTRICYYLFCAFDYFILLLVTDAFLAKLLLNMGFSDSLIGIISSIVSLALLFQISTILLASKVRSLKKCSMIFIELSHLLFISLYFVSFLPLPKMVKQIWVIVALLSAYFCYNFATPFDYKWATSFYHPKKRASHGATNEIISLIGGVIFSLFVGFMFDYFEAQNNIKGGFLFVCIAGLTLSVLSFVSHLSMAKDKPSLTQTASLKESLINTMGNKKFISVVVAASIYNASIYMTIGFMGVYKTKELMLSVGFIQVINTASYILQAFVAKPFGKFSDKHSYAKGWEYGCLIFALAFGINIFSSPEAKWCVIVFTILYTIGQAGTSQNSTMVIFDSVDEKYISQAVAFKGIISGVIGFIASLVASRILDAIQANGNTVLGVPFYGQQFLSFISFCLSLIAALYIRLTLQAKKN